MRKNLMYAALIAIAVPRLALNAEHIKQNEQRTMLPTTESGKFLSCIDNAVAYVNRKGGLGVVRDEIPSALVDKELGELTRAALAHVSDLPDYQLDLRLLDGLHAILEKKPLDDMQSAQLRVALSGNSKASDAFRANIDVGKIIVSESLNATSESESPASVAERCSDGVMSGYTQLAELIQTGIVDISGRDLAYDSLLIYARHLGDPDATFLLAHRQTQGSDDGAYPRISLELLAESAIGGSSKAMVRLLSVAVTRDELRKNEAPDAVRFLIDASNSGSSEAALTLAQIYLYGVGVAVNKSEAAKFLSQALLLGSDKAKDLLATWRTAERVS